MMVTLAGPAYSLQLMESVTDTSECDLFVLARNELVRKYADVGSAQLMSQINEPARFVHVFGSFRWVGFVHLGRSAKVGNGKTGGREIAQRAWQARAAELRALWQVHLILDPTQLQRGEAPLRSILDDCVPVPLGAAQGRDGDG